MSTEAKTAFLEIRFPITRDVARLWVEGDEYDTPWEGVLQGIMDAIVRIDEEHPATVRVCDVLEDGMEVELGKKVFDEDNDL